MLTGSLKLFIFLQVEQYFKSKTLTYHAFSFSIFFLTNVYLVVCGCKTKIGLLLYCLLQLHKLEQASVTNQPNFVLKCVREHSVLARLGRESNALDLSLWSQEMEEARLVKIWLSVQGYKVSLFFFSRVR